MRGPGEGRLRSETKPLFCSRIGAKACAELTSHSNASDWNVQECLIWLAPRLKGSWGRKRRAGEEKRRLGRHCIIPAAINSLRPEAEWTHHSDRPQAEWHWALSHPSAPPWHGSGFKQVDKAWCLLRKAVSDVWSSDLQLAPTDPAGRPVVVSEDFLFFE